MLSIRDAYEELLKKQKWCRTLCEWVTLMFWTQTRWTNWKNLLKNYIEIVGNLYFYGIQIIEGRKEELCMIYNNMKLNNTF